MEYMQVETMSASRNDFFGVIAAFFMQYQVLLIGSAILVGVLGSILLYMGVPG